MQILYYKKIHYSVGRFKKYSIKKFRIILAQLNEFSCFSNEGRKEGEISKGKKFQSLLFRSLFCPTKPPISSPIEIFFQQNPTPSSATASTAKRCSGWLTR